MRDEKIYQFILEKHLGGTHLFLRDVGVTDITTDEFHAEIKHWSDSKKLIGQLMIYNVACPRKSFYELTCLV